MTKNYELKYFDMKGYGEPIRFLLSYMGAEFKDIRFDHEKWPSIKPTTPFGKVPVLEIDGKTVCQSTAIARYLGRLAGLSGKDEWEDLMIDMAVDVFGDLIQELVKHLREEDETLKAQKLENLMKESLPFYLEKIDKLIKDNDGYLANKKVSWADIWVVTLIDATQDLIDYSITDYPHLIQLRNTIFSIPSIKSWIDRRPPPKKRLTQNY